MKDRYFYALSDCLARRKEWVRDVEIFFRFRELREKAEKETFKNNFIIYFIYKIINLPTNFLQREKVFSINFFEPVQSIIKSNFS